MSHKSNQQLAISVRNVSKYFYIPSRKRDTLVEFLSNPLTLFKRNEKERLNVLRDLSFDVKKGEFLGIIGNNGSGKSTLLKIISGIYLPNSGKVTIHGKMVPFLELGVGFNPELTARDNIYLNGIILGMKRDEVQKKFDDIVEFSELEKFLDMPLKNFSSGMQVRLAFSIAIKSHADIYIMDEVLAVGDSNFQEKCFREFEGFRDQNKTIIFVSHALELVEKFCNRVILVDGGQILRDGDPKNVVDFYRELNEKRNAAQQQ